MIDLSTSSCGSEISVGYGRSTHCRGPLSPRCMDDRWILLDQALPAKLLEQECSIYGGLVQEKYQESEDPGPPYPHNSHNPPKEDVLIIFDHFRATWLGAPWKFQFLIANIILTAINLVQEKRLPGRPRGQELHVGIHGFQLGVVFVDIPGHQT